MVLNTYRNTKPQKELGVIFNGSSDKYIIYTPQIDRRYRILSEKDWLYSTQTWIWKRSDGETRFRDYYKRSEYLLDLEYLKITN